jgi:lysylphosphatidylglycerol synthetase-like protein (DUF2156 family)
VVDPRTERRFRTVFVLAAIYDIGLGIVFTFFYRPAFDLLGMADEAPEGGYIPLLGSFVLVLGIAYVMIARGDLYRNRDLIIVGTLYKLAYSAIALFFLVIDQVPHVVFAVFGLIDVVFLVLMFQCVLALRRAADRASR